MNILHIVDEPYDSGIVHYAQIAGCALKRLEHAVHFAGRTDHFPVQQAARLGLNVLALPSFPKSVLVLRQYLTTHSIELINVHTGASHTLAVLATRAFDREIPIVRTRGDSRPIRTTATSSLLWRRTAGFIAATNRILGDFQAANPHLQIPMQAILPGIPDPGEIKEAPSQPLRVGILARLDPVKGHVHLLRTAEKVLRAIPNIRFAIAGREENVKTTHLKSFTSELGISENVEFLGYVPDVAEFMRRCHIGVVASIGSEAISRVALEWLSIGRPIVATTVGSLPEIISEGESGYLVPPEEPEIMAKYLLTLLKSPQLRNEFGTQARRRFETHFTEQRLADDTQRFYENIIFNLSPR